jgi:adenylylsulfate kinase
MSFAVWLTGLSGSGKSAIARPLLDRLHARGIDAAVLESDVLRTQLTPFASYDERERDFFYAALVQFGAMLVAQGRPVLFDATASRRTYRDRARIQIARFAEVFVDTPLEICRARDPKGLYRSGRTSTLPGVHAVYEPPLAPELVIRGDAGTPEEGAAAVLGLLERRGWLLESPALSQRVLEQSPDAIIFADREGVIRMWNARAQSLFGYAAGEAIGNSLDLIIPEHLRAAHWRGYHQAIETGRVSQTDKAMLTRATHKDGAKVYVELAFGIVKDPSRGVLGAVATGRKASRPPGDPHESK